jgi:predicted nuclease with RNAse H fold
MMRRMMMRKMKMKMRMRRKGWIEVEKYPSSTLDAKIAKNSDSVVCCEDAPIPIQIF